MSNINIYGYLELTGKSELRRNSILYFEAKCICGLVKYFRLSSLKSGSTKSCGCKKVELQSQQIITHGISSRSNPTRPIYVAYHNMIHRCYDVNSKSFIKYGAKGIIVCDEWRNDFISFYNWAISNGWENGLTLDRIIGKLNYTPNNCRWITTLEQNRNRIDNVLIKAFGEEKCIMAWVTDSRCKIGRCGLYDRFMKKGWDSEISIITPPTDRQNLRKVIRNGVVV